jgi:signal transduction histidine kinase
MSHELRTPLNSILGFAGLLEDGSCGPLNALQTQYLQDILHSSRHLLTLINDLLDLAQVEAGRIDLEPVEIEVSPFLSDITREAQAVAGAAGLGLRQEVDPHLPLLAVDPRRLKQMVLILLSNAIQFSPPGSEVVVSARLADRIRPGGASPLAGPWLAIGVRDHGVGIEPQHVDLVFRAFEQVPGSQKVCSGTGLGLSLIRRLAQLHDGHVWAESPGPGRGSTFFLALPVAGTARPAAGEAVA